MQPTIHLCIINPFIKFAPCIDLHCFLPLAATFLLYSNALKWDGDTLDAQILELKEINSSKVTHMWIIRDVLAQRKRSRCGWYDFFIYWLNGGQWQSYRSRTVRKGCLLPRPNNPLTAFSANCLYFSSSSLPFWSCRSSSSRSFCCKRRKSVDTPKTASRLSHKIECTQLRNGKKNNLIGLDNHNWILSTHLSYFQW